MSGYYEQEGWLMDFLVRLFRTLAFERRLQIVQLIAKRPGLTVGKIGAELGMPQPDTSKHVKLLS